MTTYNYVIVGGGPAGLSASYALRLYNEDNYLLIDSGDNISERLASNEKTRMGGIGGAGLFSDGHLMFYPAANNLWLLDPECLKISYNQLGILLQSTLSVPPFPAGLGVKSANKVASSSVSPVKTEETNKSNNTDSSKKTEEQPSGFHLTLGQRSALFTSLLQMIKPDQLTLHTKLYQIESTTDNIYILHCKKDDRDIEFRCRNLILSGGRFFPIVSQTFPMIKHTFKQLEMGVRICGPANSNIFSTATQIGSKIIPTNNDNLEYRTFFWCRNGKCVWAEQDGINACYGSSECTPRSQSNFGFNVCFKDDGAQKFLEVIKNTSPFEISLAESHKLHDIYGEAGVHVTTGIELFLERFGKDTNLDRQMFILKGPTVDSVGKYPLLDQYMKVPGENIWYAGDATGLFIGIVAAMLSGLFVVNQGKHAFSNH